MALVLGAVYPDVFAAVGVHSGPPYRSATNSRTALAAMHGRGVEPDYLEVVDTGDLSPVARVDGEALLAVAARVGPTRLIDNTILSTNGKGGTRA